MGFVEEDLDLEVPFSGVPQHLGESLGVGRGRSQLRELGIAVGRGRDEQRVALLGSRTHGGGGICRVKKDSSKRR